MSLVFKALADPTRRRVLELLREQDMSAGDLASHFTFSKPTMTGHFSVLREAGLVAAEKHGKQVIYRLKLSVLEDALLGFAESFGLTATSSRNKRTSKPIPKKGATKT